MLAEDIDNSTKYWYQESRHFCVVPGVLRGKLFGLRVGLGNEY